MGLLESYDQALRKRPLPVKLVTSTIMNIISELLTQRITGVKTSVPNTLRQCTIGGGLTCLVHRWFLELERRFAGWPPERPLTVMTKTTLQMVVLEPILMTCYVVGKKLLTSGERGAAFKGVGKIVSELIVSSWAVWGPVSLIQYRFVPEHYRILVANLVNLFYTMYLITRTRASIQDKEGGDQKKKKA
mmetsp:Transcript_8872/g.23782  ORF Transcript_8872/g.23782 Transcript_8872/m.23782 type:complete len:189 (-) Transcript_8872:75-641(-)